LLENGNFDEFEKLLNEHPNLIDSFRRRIMNYPVFHSWSLLMNAATTKGVSIFLYLLKHKPDLFALELTSKRNVCYFILHNNSDADALKMVEAMCKLLNPKEKTELFNHKDRDGDTPIHYAAITNKCETLEFMARSRGDIYIRNFLKKISHAYLQLLSSCMI